MANCHLTVRVLFGYIKFVETLVNEKIKVVSLFENGQIKPMVFIWRKRVYKVLRLIFTYTKNIGREKILYFSVECGGGVFELSFNREKFSWEINKIY